MAKFKILSLDGGGIRGAFGVALLNYFEEQLGEPIANYFDLIAGTSTGGIIAASVATGLPTTDIVKFYENEGPKIFSPREPHRPKGWVRHFYPMVRKVVQSRLDANFDDFFRARFCPHVLNQSFDTAFGDLKIRDVTKARLVIPTVDLTNGRTHVFRTPHLPERLEDIGVEIKDVLVAATAAPTYFPHKEMADGSTHVDGGLFAVNPAMIALAEAMKIQKLCNRDTCDPRYDTSDIHIVSIGTGIAQFSFTPPGEDAGQLYWASRVADVMFNAQADGLETPLRFVLDDRYKRLDFDLPDKSWTLDAVKNIPKLFELGRAEGKLHFDTIARDCLNERSPDYIPFTND